MRVRVIFNLLNKGAYVPFYHQYLLAQFIEGIVIKGGNNEYREFELYNFSGLKGQTKVSRNGLHYYSSKVTLVFSSVNEDFLKYFLQVLFSIKQFELGKLVLQPESVEHEDRPEFTDAMKFICISPMTIFLPQLMEGERDSKEFISPEYDLYSDLLYEATMSRLEEFGYSQEKIEQFYKFQLVPDKNYLQRIKETNKKFARIYPIYGNGQKYEIRGYTFPFTLFAAKEVNEFIYDAGIGTFTNKGFGMVDIAYQPIGKKTRSYSFGEGEEQTGGEPEGGEITENTGAE